MREVNFSVPNANKASVGITAALYDRRALDCTSTLPLINSLNHLAYLTTSSARIREILTIDGGLERLVCLLKNGRSKDVMDTWKWNLAFQCVVNIGVRGADARGVDGRGSEAIRTRVVEADMVPVIATILDNYMQVVEKLRAKHEDVDYKKNCSRFGPTKRPLPREDIRIRGGPSVPAQTRSQERRRMQPPPPIEILPAPINDPFNPVPHTAPMNIPMHPHTVVQPQAPTNPAQVLQVQQEQRQRSGGPPSPTQQQPNPFARQSIRRSRHSFTRERERERERGNMIQETVIEVHPQAAPRVILPSPVDARPAGLGSRPDTPSTQIATPTTQLRPRSASVGGSNRRAASSQQDLSMSGDSDDGEQHDNLIPPRTAVQGASDINQATIDISTDMDIDVSDAALLGASETDEIMPPPEVNGDADAPTFNITHRNVDGSIIDPAQTTPNLAAGLSPVQPPFASPVPTNTDNTANAAAGVYTPYSRQGSYSPGILASVPRDEDVIMSLQLLAFVSKYCHLRPYFQESHLVPKLKIGRDLAKIDGGEAACALAEAEAEEDNDLEYCQESDYNIFPLVEKFTVRHHTEDMRHWASVVMRNLCRKDKSRGDIRQCAYYKCGRWEKYARQFAKCRRCRQTKYCSKECQKSAWVYHRHWCEPAKDGHHHHESSSSRPRTAAALSLGLGGGGAGGAGDAAAAAALLGAGAGLLPPAPPPS